MATRKKSARKKAAVRKKVARRKAARPRAKKSIATLRAMLRHEAEEKLKTGLFRRDQAKTAKQHRAAKKQIEAARADLRRLR